tara:strand:- start:866 stop:1000 length:135 start_codon:yes stop_codon:yes gene_type:complete
MRIGVTEIKRPGSDSKETEPVIKGGGGQRKKTASKPPKRKRVST